MQDIRPLVKALDDGYSYRPDEMLRYLLLGLRELWGLPCDESVPEPAQQRVVAAIGVYSDLVAGAAPFEDILGRVYMDIASRGQKSFLAQFFTPWHVAQMMAAMSFSEAPAKADGSLATMIDPACGSGVMMLAACNHILKHYGAEALLQVGVTGIDLDRICVQMMAVQFVANCNVHRLRIGEIVVLRGDALGNGGFEPVLHASAPERHVAPVLHPKRIEAIQKAAMTQHAEMFDADNSLPVQA